MVVDILQIVNFNYSFIAVWGGSHVAGVNFEHSPIIPNLLTLRFVVLYRSIHVSTTALAPPALLVAEFIFTNLPQFL